MKTTCLQRPPLNHPDNHLNCITLTLLKAPLSTEAAYFSSSFEGCSRTGSTVLLLGWFTYILPLISSMKGFVTPRRVLCLEALGNTHL